MFQESGERFEREMQESRERAEREMRESREKAEREMRELRESLRETAQMVKETGQQMKETDRVVKETSRIVGDLGNKFGALAEHLVLPNIEEKFNALGYSFARTGPNIRFRDKGGKILTEVDALLENGDFVMAVEVKSQPTEEHVKEHIQRMEILRRYADEHGDGRKHIGAIAGAIMNEQVKRYAIKSGFYVIEQSGDTVKIDAPEGFKPREW
ncbi:MAG: hypothetical protein LBQ56_02615 [Synergistaceae bacterium]|nr:hypothetical protein [Synergistaceae bacterium]